MKPSTTYRDRWTNRISKSLVLSVPLFFGVANALPSMGFADPANGAPTDSATASQATPAAASSPTGAQLRRQTQTLADRVSKTASSIESSLSTDAVKLATDVYKLELASARLLVSLGEARDLSVADRGQLEELAIYVHRNIMVMQERVRGYAMAELDRVFPGEPDAKVWKKKHADLYRPLFRAVGPNGPTVAKTRVERRSVLTKMKADFAAAGGTKGAIFSLSESTLAKLDSVGLVEWVQLGDEIQFSEVGKHPVIADGASVRGAGSMQVIRNAGGEIMAVLVSNTSGNYKPGLSSGIGITDQLVKLGVDPMRIILTSAQPGDPSSIKLIMRSQKAPKSAIETRMRAMEKAQQRALGQRKALTAVAAARKVTQAKKAKR